MELKRTYNVLNYNTSPAAIPISRLDSILIPAGSDENPTAVALTPEEIQYASNMSNSFKIGVLRFEKDDEEVLYDLCRIRNWKEIMTNKEIEDIFVNFKLNKFEQIITNKDASLFSRIYGVYIGLKNAGVAMSANIEQAMSLRYREFTEGTTTTKITLTKVEQPKDNRDEQIKEQNDKIKALEEMVANLMNQNKTTEPKKTTATNKRTNTRNTQKK